MKDLNQIECPEEEVEDPGAGEPCYIITTTVDGVTSSTSGVVGDDCPPDGAGKCYESGD